MSSCNSHLKNWLLYLIWWHPEEDSYLSINFTEAGEPSSVWKYYVIVLGLEPDNSLLKILQDLLTTQVKPRLLSTAWEALHSTTFTYPLRFPCIWFLTPKYMPALLASHCLPEPLAVQEGSPSSLSTHYIFISLSKPSSSSVAWYL